VAKRKKLATAVVERLLVACRRRCCLCYFIGGDRSVRKGQIAHLNKRADDDRIENLVYLCFDHHDEFDSMTSQSKGLTEGEVRTWRDRLVAELETTPEPSNAVTTQIATEVATSGDAHRGRKWLFPLWLTADRLELFAYSAPGADGICAIERIDLPDGRIAIACIEMPGNPGRSITNSAEHIFEQVCETFELDPAQVVWLENYECLDRDAWRRVSFNGEDTPTWTTMTPDMWSALSLSPKKRVTASRTGALRSKIRKHFPWPPDDLALGLV
jgi:hypothetical protein